MRPHRACMFAWATLALSILLCWEVSAQTILGEFTGTIFDQSGATIPGVTVTAKEVTTGRTWSGTTNENGTYRLTSLPTGTTYDLRVEKSGFKAVAREGLVLNVGQILRMDFTLEVGSVTEVVTVTGEAPLLSLEKGEISAVVTRRKIEELPLNGRNVYQLAELQPGVVRVAGTGLQESDTTDAQISASGTRYRDNNILLDGVTNNNDRQGGRTTITLNPDAIEQFAIVTNNLSAEFGRSGGAVISVLTKAGSNDFHGSAFWYHRNDNLDAATTFESRSGGKSEFKRNQFGGTLGGPILPGKTFFLFSYQGTRQIRPALTLFTVETPEFRNFVLNTRPNSIAARLLSDFLPLANPVFNIRDVGSPASGVAVRGPNDGIPDIGDVFISVPGFVFDDQYSVRIDHTFNNGNDRLMGRYTLNDRTEQRPGDNSARAFRVDFLEKDQNIALNETHIFSSRIVNDFRIGYNYDPQINAANFQEIPHIAFRVGSRSPAAFSQTFGFVFPLDFRLHTYQLYDSLSVTTGNHGIKIGGEVRHFRENSDFPTFLRPLITFEDILDFADDEVRTFQARVDPATGTPVGTYRHFRLTEFGLFFQDDWKWTARFTLNWGIRYDNFGTLGERDDQLSTLVFSAGSSSLASAGVLTVEDLYERDSNNFAPRLGFAWDPTGTGTWAIRGGFGIFYSRVWTNFTGNSRFNPPFSLPVTLSALTPGQNPSAFYRIPFTGDPAFARPLDSQGGSTTLRPSVQVIDQDLRTPYNEQWFLGVQHRLAKKWMVEANYLGIAGRKLLLRQEINRFNGDRADGVVNRVNQSFSSMILGTNNINSSYNALTAQVVKQFSAGYTLQAAYTFSRSIDTDSEPFGGGSEAQGTLDVSNIGLDRGLASTDVTHRFAANFIYELPFFRRRGDALETALGGWQVNGIVSLQSGFPFTVSTSDDYNQDGSFNDRPNLITQLPHVVGSGPTDFLNGAFGPQSNWTNLFAQAPAGTNGNLGRNTFRGPGYATVDFSVFKAFPVPWFTSEGGRFEFRAEFFNLFNRVNLRPPSSGLSTRSAGLWSNLNFGKSLSSFDARQIQFGLKFVF